MGVLFFFKWLRKKYPNILTKSLMTGLQDPFPPSENGYTNFYIDMNACIHNASHTEFRTVRGWGTRLLWESCSVATPTKSRRRSHITFPQCQRWLVNCCALLLAFIHSFPSPNTPRWWSELVVSCWICCISWNAFRDRSLFLVSIILLHSETILLEWFTKCDSLSTGLDSVECSAMTTMPAFHQALPVDPLSITVFSPTDHIRGGHEEVPVLRPRQVRMVFTLITLHSVLSSSGPKFLTLTMPSCSSSERLSLRTPPAS